MKKKTFFVTAIIGLLLVGGAGFGFYTFKMNTNSFKGTAIPVKGLNDEFCEKWEAAFQEVLSEESLLQGIVDETEYATRMGVSPDEAISHLKEAIKVRFVKRKNAIEIGLVGKRKQNEDLLVIAAAIYIEAIPGVVEKEPSFQEYLNFSEKAKADAQSQQPPSE